MPSECGVELSPDPVIDDDMINKMNVAELRVALQASGMSKNGQKEVIINILNTEVAEGIAIIQDLPLADIENSAGDVFHPGAYWKELYKAGLDMENSIMNVEGVSFRAPTIMDEEHAEVFMDLPKKQNYEETFDRAGFTAPTRLLPERHANGKVNC